MLLKFSSMENEKQLLLRKLQEAEENSIRQNQLLSEQIEKQRLQSLSVIESLEKEKEALLQQLKQQQQQLQAQQLQQQQMLEEQRRQEELRKEMEEKEKLRRQWAEEKAAISPRRSNPSSAANSPRRAHDVSVAESKLGSPQGPRMTTTVAPPRLETMTVFHKLIQEATDLQNAMRDSMQYSQHQLKLVNQVLHQEKMGKLKSVVGKMKKEYFQQKRGIESIREEDEHHDDAAPSSSSNYPGGESKMSSTPLSPTMSFHDSPAMGGKMRKEISKKGVVPPSPMLKSRESSARFGISEASRGAATGLIGAAVGIAGGIGLAGGMAGGVASAGLGLAGGIAGGLAVGGLSAGMTAGIAMGQAIAATPGKPLGPKGSFMQGAPTARGAGGMMTPKASFSAGPGGAGKSLLTPKASFVTGGGPPRPKMSLFHMANEANQQNLQLMHQQQSAHLNTQSSPSKELTTAGQGQSMQSPLLQGQSGRPPLGKSSAPAAPAAQLAEGTSSAKQPAPAIEAAKADAIPLEEKPIAPESDPAAPLVESKASEPNSSTEQQPSADDEKKESTPGDLAKDPLGETKEEGREVKEQVAKSLEVETSEATQSAADQPYWEYAEQPQEQQKYCEDGQYHLSDQQNEGFDDYYNNELFQDLPDPHIAAAVGDLTRLQQLDAVDPSLLESVDSVGRQPLFYAVMNSQHHVMDWIFSLLNEVQEGSEQSYPQEEVPEEQQPQATTVPADESVSEEKQEPATEQQQASDAVVQQEEVPTEPVAQQTEQSVSPAEEKVAESHEPISSATEEQVTAEEKADISLPPADPVDPAEQVEISIAEEPAATAQQQEPAGEESADYSAATSGRNVANIFSMFSHYDQFGDTILHAAAATGSLVSLEKILTAHQRQIEMYPTYYEYIFLPEQFENEEDRARYIESYTYNYVNIQNFHGMTPIHLSATGQSIEKLITFGGDLSVTDQFRRTPLFIACVVNKESCVEYLIGYSDFSDEMLLAKDCFGDTPLHAGKS
jgi:ankyrin repeat protein